MKKRAHAHAFLSISAARYLVKLFTQKREKGYQYPNGSEKSKFDSVEQKQANRPAAFEIKVWELNILVTD